MRRMLLVTILVSAAPLAQADPAKRVSVDDSDSLGVVTFSRGSMRVKDDALDEVEEIAEWQRDHPDSILIIEGHTSGEGARTRNLLLSEQRTDAVRAALVAAGADPARMVLVAYGDAAGAGSSRRASARVAIRASGAFADLAREQRDPYTGEDARAARRTMNDQREVGGTVRGREMTAGGADAGDASSVYGGDTVVIVPGGEPSGGAQARSGTAATRGGTVPGGAGTTTVEDGASGRSAGGAGRTSGGTGASAQSGLGEDPTDREDRPTTNPAGTPNVNMGGG